MITNKKVTYALGLLFLTASFFSNYGVNIICASIFLSANFIIDEISKKHGK